MSWTEERIALLSKLWTEGFSASQIAKQIGGVSRNAVIGKVHRLGLSGRGAPSKPRTAAKPVPPKAASAPSPRAPRRREASPRPALRVVAPPRPIPVAAPVFTVTETGEGVALVDLKPGMCRWPIGDPQDPNFKFCGGVAEADSPYCTRHAALAYTTAARRQALEELDAQNATTQAEATESAAPAEVSDEETEAPAAPARRAGAAG